MPSTENALTSLRKHFGFSDFRDGQLEVIQAILDGKDALVVMPTGSGKSLCYQLPAMILNGATLVVSPLIALMKDQVEALQARGLPATFVNSSVDYSEQRARIAALRRGSFKLVYVAPERFRSNAFVEALKSISLSLIAIDEAHCVSTWGHDFRPDYLRLKDVIKLLGSVPTVALTATATPYVRYDIIKQLDLKTPPTFVSGFDRPNLSIAVIRDPTRAQKIQAIKRLAMNHAGSGIVYAATRKVVEQVAGELQDQGINAVAYHAGMSESRREETQNKFMMGLAQVIVATNAFGMGIDKQDVRFVVHYQMPGSVEAYYQEIGRAGRDGLPAFCLLLFNYVDKNTHDFFIEGSYPDPQTIQDVYAALMTAGVKQVHSSTSELGSRANINNEMSVQSVLHLLERAGHIKRSLVRSGAGREREITILDEKPTKLRINHDEISKLATLERRKLREMLNFCYTDACFRAYILDYFGERTGARPCGSCSNCNSVFNKGASSRSEKSNSSNPRRLKGMTQKQVTPPSLRPLDEEEALRVRKILAAAARLKGRFGKQVLAGVLRGSAAKNLMRGGLNNLSTYGLLKEMRQNDILDYIEALLSARCLEVSSGLYPTVRLTELGTRVMWDKERISLALPEVLSSRLP